MDWVIFSTIDWWDQGGAHRPTQLALALAQRGHRVLFIQTLECRPPPTQANIQVVSLGELGWSTTAIGRAWYGLEAGDVKDLAHNLDSLLTRFERSERSEPRVALWSAPFAPFVRVWPLFRTRGYYTIYDALDDFGPLNDLGIYYVSEAAERYLAATVDAILAATPSLVDKLRASNPRARVILTHNAVPAGFQARDHAPGDLLQGELTLGFWGPIQSYTVDANSLIYIARQRPDWALNLIGAYDLPLSPVSAVRALQALPNVRVLGPRPHAALMDYLAGFDVGLIPFPDNAFSRGRDPIKLYEYLAGFKPVAALHAPQLAGLPNVFLAETYTEFVEQIQAASHTAINRAALQEFLLANSWDVRAQELETRVLEVAPPEKAEAGLYVAEGLTAGANSEERLSAYRAHLESLSAERLRFIHSLESQARARAAYVKRLERFHPMIWIKRRACKQSTTSDP